MMGVLNERGKKSGSGCRHEMKWLKTRKWELTVHPHLRQRGLGDGVRRVQAGGSVVDDKRCWFMD